MSNNKETRSVQIIMDGKQPADTLKKLTNDIKALRAALNDSKIGSDAWDSHAKKLKELNGEYTQLTSKVKHAGNSFQYLKEQMKAVAVGTIGGNLLLAAGQALQNYFSGAVSYMAQTSDQLADIRRVTGMTADEVDRLDDGLSKIKSRTANKELRDIAIIAGKLGVAKDDIVGFTEATDKLNVALGGELGAIDQMTEKMGKIINAYKGAGEISEENILKIGNGIVELANSGVATGNYLIDFTRRLAGIAGTAKLGLGDVMGLAAGFEEMGQNVEVSATAVTNILTKIGSDTAKFAKFAGMSAKDFADLINDKPLEALLALAKGLQNNKQGFADIAEAFADSEIGANRVVAVMGVLGKNTDFFRQKMAEGTAGVEHSGTILDAFALKNETLAAKIDTLSKKFKAFLQSDGLNNFLGKAVDGANAFVDAISAVFSFLSKYGHLLKFTITIVASYVAWQYRSIVATRLKIVAEKAQIAIYYAIATAHLLLTGRIKATEIAQALLNRTIKATQIISNSLNFATLIGAFVAVYNLIGDVSKRYKEFREQLAQKVVSAKMDIRVEMDKQGLEENIAELDKMLKSNDKSKIELGVTLSENSMKLAEQRVSELVKNIKKKEDEIAQLSEKKSIMGITYTEAELDSKKETRLNVLKNVVEKEKQQLEIANNSVEAYRQKRSELMDKIDGIEQKAIDNKEKSIEKNKELNDQYLKDLKDFNDKLKKLLDDSRQAEIDYIADETSKELEQLRYNYEKRLELEKQNYDELIELATKLGKDKAEISNTYNQLLYDIEQKYLQDKAKLLDKAKKEEDEIKYKQEIEDAEINKNALLKVYNELYLQEKITKEQHTHNIEDIELQHKIKLLAIAKRYGKDYLDIERDIEQQRIKMLEDRIARQQRALQEEARTLTLVAQMQLDNATQKGFGVKKARQQLYEAENNELLTQLMTQEGMYEMSERNIKTIKRKYREEFDKIDQEYADAEQERRKAIAELAIDTFKQMFDAIMQFRLNAIQQEITLMQQQRDAELQALEDRKNNRLIYDDQYQLKKEQLNKKYADKERELKRKQAVAEKRAALFSIALETAKNVVQAIPNWVLVGIVSAMGALQLGLAAAQPIPYAKGGKFLGDVLQGPAHSDGGMPVLNPRTKQIVAELEGGEPILSRATYANNKELVDALLYNSQNKGGARLMPNIYSYQAPKMNNGGMIKNYYTTTYAKGGIVPTTNNQKRPGRNPSTGEKTDMLLAEQNRLLTQMLQQQQQPNVALFDYDYWEESQRRITESRTKAKV